MPSVSVGSINRCFPPNCLFLSSDRRRSTRSDHCGVVTNVGRKTTIYFDLGFYIGISEVECFLSKYASFNTLTGTVVGELDRMFERLPAATNWCRRMMRRTSHRGVPPILQPGFQRFFILTVVVESKLARPGFLSLNVSV